MREDIKLTVSLSVVSVAELHRTATDTAETQAALPDPAANWWAVYSSEAGFMQSMSTFRDNVRFFAREFERETEGLEADRAAALIITRGAIGNDREDICLMGGIRVLLGR